MTTATPPNPVHLWLHLGLAALTLLTTFGTFFIVFLNGDWTRVNGAISFALGVVAILGSHEMGHYILARVHRVDTSLPYFIPLPLLGFGTLGAVIRIRGPIPSRNALVDIGAAGPLAGLVVAIPVLILGMSWSTVGPSPDVSMGFPGRHSLWVLLPQLFDYLTAKISGTWDPSPTLAPTTLYYVFGDSLLLQGLRSLVLGPIPRGQEITEHPLAIAGWFGTFITLLNLIPIGQLDGGHLTFAMFGRRARAIGKMMTVGLLYLCVFHSATWLLWLLVTAFAIGYRHPEVERPSEPLSLSRKIICASCLLALIVCVMPVPLGQVWVP